ncbi:MAG TPA: hypothetical protein VJG65_03805 [Patescibacteria group bacterium]|nr:hypothetical protein [Patescibacteria group bacterium]
MADINLLPDELREKEERELKSAQKRPKSFDLSMSEPPVPVKEPPKKSDSVFSKIFAKKEKPMAPLNPDKILEVKKSFSPAPPAAPIAPVVKADKKRNFKLPSFNLWSKKPQPSLKSQNQPANTEGEKSVEFLDVNLMPAEMAKHPELEISKKLTNLGAVLGGIVVFVIIFYLGITWYQLMITRQIKKMEGQIIQLDDQIKTRENEKKQALDFSSRLDLVKQLLDSHIYWTNFFELLEKYTSTEVYYTNFAMAGRDKLIITAVGRDYKSVAKQLVVFQEAKDFIKNVRIDAANAQIDPASGFYQGVNFNINLEFLPGVFLGQEVRN